MTVIKYMLIYCALGYSLAEYSNNTVVEVQMQLKKLALRLSQISVQNSRCNREQDASKNGTSRKFTGTIKIYTGCQQLYEDGYEANGVYRIWIVHGYRFISVYCDMETVGKFSGKKGWIIIQRRSSGVVNFDRPWKDYVDGFGFPEQDYWMGLRNLYDLARQRQIGKAHQSLALRVDVTDWDEVSAYEETKHFSLNSDSDDFRITSIGITKSSSRSFSPLSFIAGCRFSTSDHNNDRRRPSLCAQNQRGGWWYGTCRNSNLNGVYSNMGEKMANTKIYVRFWEFINRNNSAMQHILGTLLSDRNIKEACLEIFECIVKFGEGHCANGGQ